MYFHLLNANAGNMFLLDLEILGFCGKERSFYFGVLLNGLLHQNDLESWGQMDFQILL